ESVPPWHGQSVQRENGHGKTIVDDQATASGRGLIETMIMKPAVKESPSLQWGREQLLAEFLSAAEVRFFALVLQWGREQLLAELRTTPPAAAPEPPGFNGAASSCSRNYSRLPEGLCVLL